MKEDKKKQKENITRPKLTLVSSSPLPNKKPRSLLVMFFSQYTQEIEKQVHSISEL